MAVTGRIEKPLLFALRAIGLGDFLVGVPAYRALRRAYPDHEFRLATTRALAPLAPLVGGIDGIAVASGPDDFAVPQGRPDVAVNLHGRGPQSTNALVKLEPGRLISFRINDKVVGTGPVWDDAWPRHERERWCHLLDACGITADPGDFALKRPTFEAVAEDVIVIHPGAAYASRRWPPARFSVVARAFVADGNDVAITGSASERGIAETVAVEAGLPASAVLAGKLDVVEFAALVARARLVVCGDTGAAHLATAYATPSVVLFGPTPPARWGPPPRPWHVALWHDTVRSAPADPRGDVLDPALEAITVEEVTRAAREALAARSISSAT